MKTLKRTKWPCSKIVIYDDNTNHTEKNIATIASGFVAREAI